jgi:sugar lactone lactonase YvrE
MKPSAQNSIKDEQAVMAEPEVLMEGIMFGEQSRWHADRLWFSDWGPPDVIAVDLEGNHEVMLRAPSFPCCVDWLPDGRLLIVSASTTRAPPGTATSPTGVADASGEGARCSRRSS